MSFFKRVFNIIRSNIKSDSAFGGRLEDQGSVAGKDYNFDDARSSNENFENSLSEEQHLEAEYYGNLELQNGASFEQIKSQYRKLLKKYHPDKFQNDKEKQKVAEDVVCKLNKAYSYFEQKKR